MTPDIPSPPTLRIPLPSDLGPDPEPLGMRFQRLARPGAKRLPMPPRQPALRSHRPPHIGLQRGRRR